MARAEEANENEVGTVAPQIDDLLRELRGELQADAAVFLRFGRHQSKIVVSEVRVDGDVVN